MFLIGTIFQENFTFLKLFFAFFLLLFIFYSLGKIILHNFKIENNNNYFAVFAGFIFYNFLTFIGYFFVIVINYNLQFLYYISNFIDIVLIIYILISYRLWLFKNSFVFKEDVFNFVYVFLVIIFFIYIFILIENNSSWFNSFNENSNYLEMKNIVDNDFNAVLFEPYGNILGYSNLNNFTIFESNFYWIMNLNTAFKTSLDSILNNFIPAIYIMLIGFLFKGFIIDKNNLKSNIIFPFIMMLFVLILGYQNTASEGFYFLFYLLSILMILFRYSNNYFKENTYINFILIILFLSYSFTIYSTFLTIVIGFSLIFYLINLKENIFTTIFYLIIILFLQYSLYLYAVSIFYSIIFIAFSLLIIISPLSLFYFRRNQNQLYKFENTIKENPKNAMFFLISILSILIIVSLSISVDKYGDLISQIFNNNVWIWDQSSNVDPKYSSVSLYILITLLMFVLALIIYYERNNQKYLNFNNYFIYIVLSYFIGFNMIILPTWFLILKLPVIHIETIFIFYISSPIIFLSNFYVNYKSF